jgi:hypothetical protein
MRRRAGDAPEHAHEVIRADAGPPGQVGDGMPLIHAVLHVANDLRHAALMPGGYFSVAVSPLARFAEGNARQLVSYLLQLSGLADRADGPRRHPCKGTDRREAIAAECFCSCANVSGDLLQQLRSELEREAPVAFAVLVGALERFACAPQEQRASGQQRTPALAAADEGAGEHERHRRQRMPLFDPFVARPAGADEIHDLPP